MTEQQQQIERTKQLIEGNGEGQDRFLTNFERQILINQLVILEAVTKVLLVLEDE